MEKLEYLQKLNPYLPYDLVVISGDSYDTDDRLDHKGVMTYGHSSDDNSRSKDFSITEIAFSENNIVTRLGVIKRKVKPVLKPLSDLYKEIDGEVPADVLFPKEFYSLIDFYEEHNRENQIQSFIKDGLNWCEPYSFWEYLFSKHFDMFSLIDKGLAIDLNSISHE